MRRQLRLIPIVLIMAAMPLLLVAQDAPTPETLIPEITPEVTEAAPIISDAISVLISARSDLELLANNVMGGARPVGWNGTLDISDPQLALKLRLDLDLLAGNTLGADVRPAGWFGAMGGSEFNIARDIRHDVELLADTLIEPGVRPPGWGGGDPLMTCNRATQSLIVLLERSGFALTANPESTSFCADAELEASRYVDSTMLTAPSITSFSQGASVTGGWPHEAITGAAVFFDRSARRRAGVMPVQTEFSPIARSTTAFSNMMVVEGEGFRLYIDYLYTSVDNVEFDALPDVNELNPNLYCTAVWCQ